jgi:hypothetical protein
VTTLAVAEHVAFEPEMEYNGNEAATPPLHAMHPVQVDGHDGLNGLERV